jgi:SAM-dependent methyltransferase
MVWSDARQRWIGLPRGNGLFIPRLQSICRACRICEIVRGMITSEEPRKEPNWRCLYCRGPLTMNALGLRCPGCGKQYPVIAGIPILVSEPAGYLRSELALLTRASRDARQRRDLLDRTGRDVGLPTVSLNRHRDVIDADIAQAETLLALLEPAAKALEALADSGDESLGARRSGWAFDTLLPYLLRDWTSTAELEAANSMIGAALKQVFPDPSGKSVAFAGCGAGGLLAEISSDFERVLGFDLTLPILAAARHLLDRKSLDLALPRTINTLGRISLRKRDPGSASSHAELLAMDAFDTSFAEDSIDCVITSFLIDLIPDPRRLADEIHRILCRNGVWINYGPSGPLKALWRFDQTETAAFFEAAGFAIVRAEAHRTTYLDLSRDCPSWSYRNHMCYLTSARKTTQAGEKPRMATPNPAELPEIIPQHFPGANLVQRQSLGTERTRTTLLRRERIPGRAESFEIGSDTARIMALVDGKRTVHEIADMLQQEAPAQPVEETIRAFARYFNKGLLSWRDRGR